MDAVELLRATLLADTTVASYIGTRVTAVQLPQNPVYDAITYQQIGAETLYTQDGVAQGTQGGAGKMRFRLTIHCQGKVGGVDSYLRSRTIAKAVRAVMDRTLDLWNPPGSPPTFKQAPNKLLAQRDNVEPNTQPPVFQQLLDYETWFQDQ